MNPFLHCVLKDGRHPKQRWHTSTKGKTVKDIHYWHSTKKNVDLKHYDEDNRKKDWNKRGSKRTVKPEEWFFLVTSRLRHLAFLFDISHQNFCFLDQDVVKHKSLLPYISTWKELLTAISLFPVVHQMWAV